MKYHIGYAGMTKGQIEELKFELKRHTPYVYNQVSYEQFLVCTSLEDLCKATITKRGYGYYEIKFFVENRWVGTGYATNERNANKIAQLFVHPDAQYTQDVNREIVKL